MKTEKRNRIIAAVTVNAVLLIVIFVAVLIYQIVEISILSARKKALTEEYNNVMQELEDSEDWLDEFNLNQEGIMYILALQNGYTIP
jgi:cell division protein FtsI/penicillin-binding protein 2